MQEDISRGIDAEKQATPGSSEGQEDSSSPVMGMFALLQSNPAIHERLVNSALINVNSASRVSSTRVLR